MAYKWSRGRVDTGDLVSSDDVDRDTKIDFEEDQIKLIANNTEYLAIGTGSTNVEVSGVIGFNGGVAILENGRVGIGTDAPDYKLDVAGNVGVNQYIYHNGDANTFINFTDNRVRINAGGNNHIDCQDNSSAPHKVRINNGGNNIDFVIKDSSNNVYFTADASTSRVGIGTETPSQALHVAGNLEVSGNDARVKIHGFTDSHPGLEFHEAGTRKWIIFNDYGDDSLDFKTDSNTRMVIKQDGNVGIGTDSPDYTLDVAGNIGADEYIYHNGDDNTFIRFQDDSINLQAGGADFITLTEASQDEVVINESSTDMDFRVESNQNTHMFHVDGQNQRIGIGTNSAQSVLHIVDPFDSVSGQQKDVVLIMKGQKEVGIKLIADTANTVGETENPFIDFYSDGLTDTSSRQNRLASLSLEGTAGTTMTSSLASAFLIDAFCPNHANSALRVLQIGNDSSNNGHAARITLEGTNGHVGIHTNNPSTEMEVIGTTKSDFFATDVTTQDLGSGTSATLSTASGIVLLDAGSINGSDMGGGMEVFSLAFPTPTVSGQKLTIIAQNADTNNVFVLPSGLVSGSFSSLHDSSGISAITFVQIVEGNHKAWYQIGKGV